jgi:DNA-binding beta-propeller fold protein YncE
MARTFKKRDTWKDMDAACGVLYASTYSNGSVVAFDADEGKVLRTYTGMQTAEGVAVDVASGQLFVADRYGSRIMVFDLQTCAVTRSLAKGELAEPHGIAFENGLLYIADHRNKKLRALDTITDEFLWATEGSILHPSGIAVDDTCVYATLYTGACIGCFDKCSGAFLSQISPGIQNPQGLKLLGTNFLLVAESGNDVVRVVDKTLGATVRIFQTTHACDAVAVDGYNVFMAGHWNKPGYIHVYTVGSGAS